MAYDPRLSDFRHFQSHSRDDELVFAHLLIRSQQLYATMDSHMEEAGLLFATSLAGQTKRVQDPTHKVMFQTASSSAVPLSVHQMDDVIWNGFFKGVAGTRPGVNVSALALNVHAYVPGIDRAFPFRTTF